MKNEEIQRLFWTGNKTEHYGIDVFMKKGTSTWIRRGIV